MGGGSSHTATSSGDFPVGIRAGWKTGVTPLRFMGCEQARREQSPPEAAR